jgi:tRNA nucleotidyltransferase (CCA-adding enzyme)
MSIVPTSAERHRERLLSSISPDTRQAMLNLGASVGNASLWAVGGVPRDLILGRSIDDIDLVVEGDAIALARRVFAGRRVRAHPRFGTASVAVGGTRIDVAMSRRETYRRPGALPAVEPASIEEDLRRRDFTINAMALRLNHEAAFLDPCGGRGDISRRSISTLHAASFRDDATRIFRAYRYEARLGFTLAPGTAEAARRDVKHVESLSGPRVRRELELLLSEGSAGTALRALDRERVLRQVHPGLSWSDVCGSGLTIALSAGVDRTATGFALLARDANEAAAAAIVLRLRLTRGQASAVMAMPPLMRSALALTRPSAKPSGVVLLLDRFPVASVAALAATAPDRVIQSVCLRYLGEWRHVHTMITGDDVQHLGVPTGPRVAQGLQLARAARLDGWATSREDEAAVVQRFAASIGDAERATATIEIDGDD